MEGRCEVARNVGRVILQAGRHEMELRWQVARSFVLYFTYKFNCPAVLYCILHINKGYGGWRLILAGEDEVARGVGHVILQAGRPRDGGQA